MKSKIKPTKCSKFEAAEAYFYDEVYVFFECSTRSEFAILSIKKSGLPHPGAIKVADLFDDGDWVHVNQNGPDHAIQLGLIDLTDIRLEPRRIDVRPDF